jgi:phospholipid transport system substrate-binding protein
VGIARRHLVVLAALLAVALPTLDRAEAATPTEQLRISVDRVIRIVDDAELKKEGRARERRATLRKAADEIFDFNEAAKRALGRHWQARSAAERKEFVELFTAVLERAYVSKIELYNGERITYHGESVDGTQAIVRTKILTKQGTAVPVDYKMLRQRDRWRVYDVVIEGVSLVANYRTQFEKIIQASSYQDLVKKLKTQAASAAARTSEPS